MYFVTACVKIVKQRALLESQLNENKCVLDELNLLGPDNKVYKLFGPVLVKQELEDSRQNVGKRIEYISKELKSSTDTLENMYVYRLAPVTSISNKYSYCREKDMLKHREAVSKYQQQWQVAAAMKWNHLPNDYLLLFVIFNKHPHWLEIKYKHLKANIL